MKKTVFSLALALALVLAVGTAFTFAASVVPSPQKLLVNNQDVKCEIYNIDGYNYFKLRDIAYMLNNTPGQFGIEWNSEAQTISVTTGSAYTPVGGELETGTDKSKSAVVSSQKLIIDGELIEGLSVYNIGGNNFFKLKDIGNALGFEVDYDEDTNTMIINSFGPREASDITTIEAKPGDPQTFDGLIFSEDVTVTGTAANVTFTNCEFQGDIINKVEGSALISIDISCTLSKDTDLIISNTKKEADLIEDGFPKFGVFNSKNNIICEDCFGAAICFGDEIQFNGKVYSAADIVGYYDAEQNAIVPYTGQEYECFMISQYWENGEKMISVFCE